MASRLSPYLCACLLASMPGASSQESSPGRKMDYGDGLMCSVLFPKASDEPSPPSGSPIASAGERARLAALKGMVIRQGELSYAYDLDRVKFVAAWFGSPDLKATNIGNYKGYASGAVEIPEPMLTGDRDTTTPSIRRFLGHYRTASGIVLRYEEDSTSYRYEDRSLWLLQLWGSKPGATSTNSSQHPNDLAQSLWPSITVEGKLGAAKDSPYVVDPIPLPENNPWNSWIRPSGFDFLPDGRLAVCTINGDVWLVSGVDASLEKVTWKRFAAGLYEPLGLKVVDGKIFVRGRDQITRLHDLNGDDEADYYERFNADNQLWLSYHAFIFDLQADSKGNLYYVSGGNALGRERPWYAQVFRVSPDGKTTHPVASGFRAPNGLTVGPDDSIYATDNQGHWIPASKISRIREGGFYGHVADPRLDANSPAPASYDPPLCWLPMSWDNSSGGGAIAPKAGWGPLSGAYLHTSFGMASMLAVFPDRDQAAAIKLPWKFDSGVMRARFSPTDGALYVTGLKGWQSRATRDGCLHRVRYVGGTWDQPIGWSVSAGRVSISFAEPLDRAAAEDSGNYAAEQWSYLWNSTYGSPEVSVSDPKLKRHDPVEITAAKLSADGKTVTLEIPNLAPVMQLVIKCNGTFANGAPLKTELAGTINRVPAGALVR